jgi:asparagine synthase (glutamine-hydrolysing)
MCGIAGIRSADAALAGPERLRAMADSLRHRGPEGEGFYQGTHEGTHLGLAHRRLAITDPSDLNRQPFRYLNRYVVVHNGEIYNHAELRKSLEQQGCRFSTKGDTEVIAAAYALHGPQCLQQFDGMFAFAIWDEAEGVLFCARDRFGEKPFYYHWDEPNRCFRFASEMKALWAAGAPRRIQPGMFLHYLTLGQVYHPDLPELTFYQDIFQLPPAHSLTCRPGMDGIDIKPYWDIDKESTLDITADEALRDFRRRFERSVSLRLQSDRPMAAMVSGGLDSSTLLAAAHMLSGEMTGQPGTSAEPVTGRLSGRSENHHRLRDSVSAVFPGFVKDESYAIQAVNDFFRLSPHPVEPSGKDLAAGMEVLARHQEEPFSSSSVWAQHTVYGHAKTCGFTVMADGQGADEILGGYERHIPWALREGLAQEHRASGLRADAFRENGFNVTWDYRSRISAFLPGLTTAFLERRARREQAGHPFISPRFLEEHSGAGFIRKPLVRKLNDILYHDTMQGPLQELLRYADRNAMAHGVETRMPFLSHELVEFLFSIPAAFKMREGWTKWILRAAYRSSVPDAILYRKGKTGFEPPQAAWMSLPSAQAAIGQARQKLVDAGMLKPSVLRRPLQPTGAYDRHPYDWRIWMAAHFI